jgi:broad specificity phosphatase PhoE
MLETEIYLIRHGESVANVEKTYSDTSLTERGREQAQAVTAKLPAAEITALYTSHLKRAKETAQIIEVKLPQVDKIELRENLEERRVGELMDRAVMMRTHAKYTVAIRQGEEALWDLRATADSENFADAYQRFITELEQIAQNHPGEKIVVISHGGLMRALLVKLGFANFRELIEGVIENTAIIKLKYSSGHFTLEDIQGVYLAENQ